MRHGVWATCLLLAAAPSAWAQEAGPGSSGGDLVAQGKRAFDAAGCGGCHFPGSIVAPPLEGVAGRRIAGAGRYAYSTGLRAKAGTWTDANLDAFLTDAQAFAPGTEMLSPATDEGQRQAIIAYLKTLP